MQLCTRQDSASCVITKHRVDFVCSLEDAVFLVSGYYRFSGTVVALSYFTRFSCSPFQFHLLVVYAPFSVERMPRLSTQDSFPLALDSVCSFYAPWFLAFSMERMLPLHYKRFGSLHECSIRLLVGLFLRTRMNGCCVCTLVARIVDIRKLSFRVCQNFPQKSTLCFFPTFCAKRHSIWKNVCTFARVAHLALL